MMKGRILNWQGKYISLRWCFQRWVSNLIPYDMRLNRCWDRLNRYYLKKIEGVQDRDEKEKLYFERRCECGIVEEEIEERKTQRLIKKASKLDIPIPHRPYSSDDENEYWEFGYCMGRAYLNPVGITNIRNAIYATEKQRREAMWFWVTVSVSIIGAITGLSAVILTLR